MRTKPPTPPRKPRHPARDLPPHPATLVQPKRPFGGIVERPPHPATVAQKKAGSSSVPGPPPHPATVAQPRSAPDRAARIAQPSFLLFDPKAFKNAPKDFLTGTTIITQSEIRAAVIASLQSEKAERIGSTHYSVRARQGYVHLYFGEDQIGYVRFSISGKVSGVQTINVAKTYQGQNHSRLLITAFAITSMKLGALQYTLATEDTSKGWWSQWGTTIFSQLLKRGDLATIYVATNPNDEVDPAKRLPRARLELEILAHMYGWSNAEFERQAKIRAGILPGDAAPLSNKPLHDYSSEYIS